MIFFSTEKSIIKFRRKTSYTISLKGFPVYKHCKRFSNSGHCTKDRISTEKHLKSKQWSSHDSKSYIEFRIFCFSKTITTNKALQVLWEKPHFR